MFGALAKTYYAEKKGIDPKLKVSKEILEKQYFDDKQSSPKNNYVYNGIITNGTLLDYWNITNS